MSQNDMVIANADGATVRADINSALQALASMSSGTSAPSTTYAGQWWWDTTNNLIKIRNGANNAWITAFTFDGTTLAVYAGINSNGKAKGTTIASASTVDLGSADSDFIDVSGAVTITSLGSTTTRNRVTVNFTGAPLLTYNATSLLLPGAANIQVVAGDVAVFERISGSNWQCVEFTPITALTSGTLLYGGGHKPVASGINVSASNAIDGYIGSFNDQTGTTYTTVNSDTGKILTFSNAGAIAVTLHKAAPKGTCFTWDQKGAGQVTFAAETGGAILQASSLTKSRAQHSCGTAFVESNAGSAAQWVLSGDMA